MNVKKIIPGSAREKMRLMKAASERALFRLLWIFPVDNTKIICSNFNGKGYGDNPRYIAEEFIKRGKGRIYWLLKDPDQKLPTAVTPIKYGSLRSFYHLATAGFWIDSNRKEPYVVKRKKQYYLQTWHGSIPLKKIEKDAEESLSHFYILNAVRDAKMTDLMIADSTFSADLYSTSFWFEGEVKRLGTPRFDALFDKSNVSGIKGSLGIKRDQFVILYAPTFRNNADKSVYDIDLASVRSVFERKTGREAAVLVKMHPHIPLGYIDYDKNIAKDVSAYPDIYDLMKISDVLITDYSSTMFEFPVADPKPVFCYAKDLETYERGFYFDPDELPFIFAKSNQELIEGISSFDQDGYEHKILDFYKKIGLHADGQASKHVVNYLLQTDASHASV